MDTIYTTWELVLSPFIERNKREESFCNNDKVKNYPIFEFIRENIPESFSHQQFKTLHLFELESKVMKMSTNLKCIDK